MLGTRLIKRMAHTTISSRLLDRHLLPRQATHLLWEVDTRISLDGALQQGWSAIQTSLMLLRFLRRVWFLWSWRFGLRIRGFGLRVGWVCWSTRWERSCRNQSSMFLRVWRILCLLGIDCIDPSRGAHFFPNLFCLLTLLLLPTTTSCTVHNHKFTQFKKSNLRHKFFYLNTKYQIYLYDFIRLKVLAMLLKITWYYQRMP